MKRSRSSVARTTALNPSFVAALSAGTGLILAIAAGQVAHAQTDPAGVDNSVYGELVGERYKNEEASKGKGQEPGRAERSGVQGHDGKKGSERSSNQAGAGGEAKPAQSPASNQGNR
jgi:uncharacterized membrane protein YgcG